MKVGILTFHFAYNYGAVLQAWGLQQAVESLGHEVCIINYVPNYMKHRISTFRGWGIRSGSKFLTTFCHRLRESKRRKSFCNFTHEYFRLSKRLLTKNAMQEFCEGLDAVIVGSDQVWNLNWLSQFDDTYFLGFLEETKPRKIAYGACFGQIDQPERHLAKACRLIKHFDCVGVRNQFGRHILAKNGIKAETIVDPGVPSGTRCTASPVFLVILISTWIPVPVVLSCRLATPGKISCQWLPSRIFLIIF